MNELYLSPDGIKKFIQIVNVEDDFKCLWALRKY